MHFGLFDMLDKRHTLSPDGISSVLLWWPAALWARPFYILFNESLTAGKVPSICKDAYVILIHEIALISR